MPWIRWRKTKDGRRLAALQWRDEHGRVRSRALKTSDERLAQMHLRQAVREMGEACRGVSVSLEPQALLDRFLAERALQVAPATVSIDKDRLGRLVAAWKGLALHEWSRTRLVEYVASHGWSGRSTQIFLRCCRRFIRWAQDQDIPMPDFVGSFRGPAVQSVSFEPLTAKAVRDLLRVARGTYLELPIALGVYAGLSLSDICELTWDQVDLERDVIERTRSKTGVPVRMPIAPTLREVLARNRAMRGPVCRGLPTKESMGRALRRLFERVGVNGGRGTWHRLRHTLGDLMAQQGTDLATVGRGLAHRPGSIVTLRYQHSSMDRLRNAVEAMDERIGAAAV